MTPVSIAFLMALSPLSRLSTAATRSSSRSSAPNRTAVPPMELANAACAASVRRALLAQRRAGWPRPVAQAGDGQPALPLQLDEQGLAGLRPHCC